MVTQNMLRMHEGNEVFSEKKIILFLTAPDLITEIDQITEIAPSCAPIFDLPSRIRSMFPTHTFAFSGKKILWEQEIPSSRTLFCLYHGDYIRWSMVM